MSKPSKPTIAICYDFDGTLIRGNMQENSFIPELKQSKEGFWETVKKYAEEHDMDEVLSYMQIMLDEATAAKKPFDRASIAKHGENMDLFPGVADWFDHIKEHADKEANIEHYVISSGLEEMIKESSIGKKFKYIFASGFMYDANNVAKFPARAINYTTKVQYLFRINKGIENSWDNSTINKPIAEKDRTIPFSQMIYIGDGDTDVPAMKMINHKGGYSIAVYPPRKGARITKKEKEKQKSVEMLYKDNRCQFISEANYKKDEDLFKIVTMLIDRIVNEHKFKMNLDAK